MESEERLTYYPLPLADTEVFSDRNLRKAIKSSGFRMDGSVFGQIVNGAGETLVLLGEGESTAALSETTWDIFRAMDSRSKLTHQRRLFPCEGKFGEIFGRTVTSEHPAYGAWYELSDGF